MNTTLSDEVAQLEPVLHRAEYHGSSREQIADVLAEDYLEFASTGIVYTRDEVIESMHQWHSEVHPTDPISDLAVAQIADDLFRSTYTLHQPGRSSLRLTIWRKTNGVWRAVFHQGTVIPPDA